MAAGGRDDGLDVATARLWLGLRESAQRFCGLALEGARRVSQDTSPPATSSGAPQPLLGSCAAARGFEGNGGVGGGEGPGAGRNGPAPAGVAQKPREPGSALAVCVGARQPAVGCAAGK